ncbi:MAG: helix-turn-helix transcriptional regulator [Elusimicrobia bacterium]|nr:helix-turn-helix transcriptional regulator [Elusimicrobiota bacterium]
MQSKNNKLKVLNRLKVLRAEKEITQEELAEKVGVTRVTINCIERGVYLPTLELGLALARFFQKPVEEIFIVEEPHEKSHVETA